jgi:hypothetical protein
MFTLSQAARHWLELGFDLLPIQPNSKMIVAGFGQYKQRITRAEDVSRWWHDGSSFNLAIVAKGENFILDFDDFDLYENWLRQIKQTSEAISTSYTEYTPRGGAHVFLCGEVLKGLQLREGVEVKQVVLVAPSVIGGQTYETVGGDIYRPARGDLDLAFSLLSKVGTRTPYVLRIEIDKQARITQTRRELRERRDGLAVDVIKSRVSVLDVLAEHAPAQYATLKGSGRFRACCCPFHKSGHEARASFWIDTEQNLFGCHTCKTRGDVINLYGQLRGMDNKQAIRALVAQVAK